MDVSPIEAEESLAAIKMMTQKTRRAIAGSGTYITLLFTGIIWLVGYSCTQFLPKEVVGYIWTGIIILGVALSVLVGVRMGPRVRNPSMDAYAKRAGIFWALLILFCSATIAVAGPTDGKQAAVIIILFTMIGQLAMGLLVSFSSTWWTLPVSALALVGYFLFPGIFYLWMAVLGGGGMIAFALYIRSRW